MTLKSDAHELALIAQEIVAEVIQGPVRYPGRLGDIEVGGVDTFGEYLYELKGQEVMLIVAPLGPVEELAIICGLCGLRELEIDTPHRLGPPLCGGAYRQWAVTQFAYGLATEQPAPYH